jgi:hypothetical protein
MASYYIGHFADQISGNYFFELFTSKKKPTEDSHGHLYKYVTGPFSNKVAAVRQMLRDTNQRPYKGKTADIAQEIMLGKHDAKKNPSELGPWKDKKINVWDIYSYDVWGNSRDGYEVNDTFKSGYEIELPEDYSDVQLLKAMKDSGFIKKTVKLSQLSIDGDGESYINIDEAKNGRPFCELRKRD